MARSDPEPPPHDPLAWSVRDRAAGRFVPRDDNADVARALGRFRAKCRFDPRTGCVLWTGATTRGRGNTATYGGFWYDGRRWFAHRWAAAFIHGIAIDGLQVGHCCPHTPDGHPNTLCVQHLRGETQLENLDEMHARRRLAAQSPDDRQYWLLIERGYDEAPPVTDPNAPHPVAPDFYPPEWLGLTNGD